jgi:hypothetical protein
MGRGPSVDSINTSSFVVGVNFRAIQQDLPCKSFAYIARDCMLPTTATANMVPHYLQRQNDDRTGIMTDLST